MVFGIVGCVMTRPLPSDSRNIILGCGEYEENFCRQSSHFIKFKNKYPLTEIQKDYSLVAYPKAEAINIEKGERFHFGHSVYSTSCTPTHSRYETVCPKAFIKEMCEQVFGSECIISRFNDDVYFKSLEDYYLQKEKSLAQEKRYVLQNLKSRCIDYGFNGELNIMACIQMDAQHYKELAMQKLELQRANAENITKSSEEEEDLPFLIKFLGDVAVGVAEGMTDPAFQMHIQQQREINRLKANQN